MLDICKTKLLHRVTWICNRWFSHRHCVADGQTGAVSTQAFFFFLIVTNAIKILTSNNKILRTLSGLLWKKAHRRCSVFICGGRSVRTAFIEWQTARTEQSFASVSSAENRALSWTRHVYPDAANCSLGIC